MLCKQINYAALDNMVNAKKHLIIDLRSYEEYSEGHILNSVNIPYEIMDSYVKQKIFNGYILLGNGRYDTDYTFVLYCDRGFNSMLICFEMRKNGFKAFSVGGGIRNYNGNYWTTGNEINMR